MVIVDAFCNILLNIIEIKLSINS